MTESVMPVEGVAYSANVFDDLIEALALHGDAATQGVIRGKLNALAVTGTSSPVAVASGWALVNGKLYKNTASVNVSVSTPATNPRIDRVVLRLDYTAGPPATCVIALLAGTAAASPVAPTLTQTDGTKWEISLAQVLITTGGVITVTDERAYIGDGHVATSSIADAAVTSAKLAAAVAGNGLTGGAGTALAVGAGTGLTVGADSVGITNGGVGTTQMAADAVDDTIVGLRVPRMPKRRGGSDTIWGGLSGGPGSSVKTVTTPLVDGGADAATGLSGTTGTFDITFSAAFGYAPLVFVFPMSDTVVLSGCAKTGSTTTKAEITWHSRDGSAISTIYYQWLAIGPEA